MAAPILDQRFAIAILKWTRNSVSRFLCESGGTGRRSGLKTRRASLIRVRFSSFVPIFVAPYSFFASTEIKRGKCRLLDGDMQAAGFEPRSRDHDIQSMALERGSLL